MSALSDRGGSPGGFNVSPEAQVIVAHAQETFGSEGKARLWLERPNPLLGGATPIHILQTDPAGYELVDDELTRIDYGVFV